MTRKIGFAYWLLQLTKLTEPRHWQHSQKALKRAMLGYTCQRETQLANFPTCLCSDTIYVKIPSEMSDFIDSSRLESTSSDLHGQKSSRVKSSTV
ncbi:hypothetical protein B0H10DRAFT_1975680 [Mycena sp. CBHHK59/15]|nr:hypothetical protein B0H10DRAFT_1975680 [Mycena sp. CBHHK59/15]